MTDWNIPKLICNAIFLSQILSLKIQDPFVFTVICKENNICDMHLKKKKKHTPILTSSCSSQEKGGA